MQTVGYAELFVRMGSVAAFRVLVLNPDEAVWDN